MSGKDLWGGRFRRQLESSARRFSSSPEDALLLRYDIAGSIAHAMGLERAGLLSTRELNGIVNGLRSIYHSYSERPEKLLSGEEDVHMAVEKELTRMNPDHGPKLHTARSRNDQVALDLRLYSREALLRIGDRLLEMERALLAVARKHLAAPVPGYTHMQRAQPVYLSHHLLSHLWRFSRDMERLEGMYRLTDSSPLGAGAIAGSSHGIDPSYTSALLGFGRWFSNSLDATSDRESCLDIAFLSSMIALHLSSIAEEVVMWSTSEFGYITLPDELSTGSSLMPHKKNPDIAELVRGKCGYVTAQLMSLIVTLKGLPEGYARDLQEVKRPLLVSSEEVCSMLQAMSSLVSGIKFNRDRMAENASDQSSHSVEIVDELVREGVAFRKAHSLVGQAVAEAAEKGETLQHVVARMWPDVHFPASPAEDIEKRSSPGGSSLSSVRRQVTAASRSIAASRRWIASRKRAIACVDRLLGP